MPSVQTIQETSARANDLLARLAETSEGAVKTREKLFSDLKDEINEVARVEEEQILPILRKHKETSDIAREAANDSRKTRSLVSELERAPKDSAEFSRKLSELRRVFQSHIRDDKKELLAAVRDALGEDETGIGAPSAAPQSDRQADRASHEPPQAQEAEGGRKARDGQDAQRAMPPPPERAAHAGQKMIEGTARMAEAALDQFGDAVPRVTHETHEALRHAGEDISAIAIANTAFTNRYQDVWMEWMDYTRSATRETMTSIARFTTARTPHDLINAQFELMKRELELFLESNARISQLSAEAALSARRRMSESSPGEDQRTRRRA